MAAKLCTAAYFQQVADKLNASEDFQDDASEFTFYFLFRVSDGDVACTMNFDHGTVTECRDYEPGDEDKVGYVVDATRASWEDLANGKLDAVKGIVTGKIKLKKGSKMNLLKNLDSAGEIFETMGEVPYE